MTSFFALLFYAATALFVVGLAYKKKNKKEKEKKTKKEEEKNYKEIKKKE